MKQSQQKRPKVLACDIETAPHTAHVWSLFKQTVSLSQLQETGRVLCLSWRWLGEKGQIGFVSELEGRKKLLDTAHRLLDEADIVVTYNGKKFDVPTLNKELFENGYKPPSPYKQVDLYRSVRSQFRFASNKLDHVARSLGIRTKVRHSGHELWVQCMAGDPKAWKKMEKYNKRDVLILDKLYHRMLPWIVNHPNVTLYTETSKHERCPTCATGKLIKRGMALSKTHRYQRFQCSSCGAWSRSRICDKERQPVSVVAL